MRGFTPTTIWREERLPSRPKSPVRNGFAGRRFPPRSVRRQAWRRTMQARAGRAWSGTHILRVDRGPEARAPFKLNQIRWCLRPRQCYTPFGSPQPDIRFGQRTANSFNCSEYGEQGFLRPALRPFARTAIQVSERVLFGNAWLPGPRKLRLRFATEFPVESTRRPPGSPSGTDRSAARPSEAAESPHEETRESA